MKQLTTEQIRWNRSCGYSEEFFAIQHVLNYADGRSSLEEYAEFYNSMSLSSRKIADKTMAKIAASTPFKVNVDA
jgi:hypothetical protein